MNEILHNKYWMLETAYFNRVTPIVLNRLASGRDLSPLINEQGTDGAPMGTMVGTQYSKRVEGENFRSFKVGGKQVAFLPMQGVLTKHGDMCAYGAIDLEQMIIRANANDDIAGIVLHVDGPGGSVAGTVQLANAVANSAKPVVPFIDGMAASAHYYVASRGRTIVANNQEYNQVGSIGVLSVLVNESAALAKEGLDVRILRAEQSVDKAKLNPIEPFDEKVIKEYQDTMTKMAADFIASVKAGRGARLNTGDEDIFTGKVYSGEQAAKMGMIDYLGNMEAAVEIAAGLA